VLQALAEAVVALQQQPAATPPSSVAVSGALAFKLGDKETSQPIAIVYGTTTSFALTEGVTASIFALKQQDGSMYYSIALQGTTPNGNLVSVSSAMGTPSGKPVKVTSKTRDGDLSFSFTPD
jgi:hypothetical protein